MLTKWKLCEGSLCTRNRCCVKEEGRTGGKWEGGRSSRKGTAIPADKALAESPPVGRVSTWVPVPALTEHLGELSRSLKLSVCWFLICERGDRIVPVSLCRESEITDGLWKLSTAPHGKCSISIAL